MITFRSFLNKIADISYSFFSSSLLHKRTIGPNGLRYVGHITRFTSTILDMILYTCILYVIASGINMFFGFSLPLDIVEKYKLGVEIPEEYRFYIKKYMFITFFSQIIQVSFIFLVNIYMWHKYGATPAKFITGIIILDEETLSPPNLKQSIKRFCALLISVLPCFLGIIWVIFDKKGRSWHDKIAGTIVVAKSSLKQTNG